jgi:serine/threonine protein kinase
MGIVHRDLKPENIMYTAEDGILKITDFGLARYFDEDVMMTSCGTPCFMAPELIRQSGYGVEVDNWSIGIIAYILLCGYPPFNEDELPSLFEEILLSDIIYPSPEWDNISSAAKNFVDM